jgi:hypothetical protein
MAQPSVNESKTESKAITPSFTDVVVLGKYNPALFPIQQYGLEGIGFEIVQRGMDTAEQREFLHTDLLDPKRCSARFLKRNTKVSDCKLNAQLCSYCGKANVAKDLFLFVTIVHANDILMKEIAKKTEESTKEKCIFHGLLIYSLETKMRDVRSNDLLTINKDCALVCITRCVSCMKPVDRVDKSTQTTMEVLD